MRRVLSLVAVSAMFSILAFAESWSGSLIDAACYDQKGQADTCAATSGTTAFALVSGNKIYKLDAEGNEQASEALKSRADRSTDPDKPSTGKIMARVTGKEEGGVITVESLEVN